MFRLDSCVLQAHTLQALWQWERENKAHVFLWSWNSVSSVGHIHVLKDEAHSAWNVHLSQHNHVSAIERNTEHDDLMSKGHDALSHFLQVTVTFTLPQAPRRHFYGSAVLAPTWDSFEASTTRGRHTLYKTQRSAATRAIKDTGCWRGTIRRYRKAALRLQCYSIQVNNSNIQNTALHQDFYLSSCFVFCHFKN